MTMNQRVRGSDSLEKWGKPRLLAAISLVGVLIVSAVAVAAQLPPGGTFSDDDGNVHEGYIEAIAARGITRGCNPPANDLYCPEENVTRGQMAAFLVRALDLAPYREADIFDDDNDSVFEEDIQALAAAGITKGCNPPANDSYCPDEYVKRDQMASFLGRALSLEPNVPPPPTTTSSTSPSTSTTNTGSSTTSSTTTTVPVDPDVAWSCSEILGSWSCSGNTGHRAAIVSPIPVPIIASSP